MLDLRTRLGEITAVANHRLDMAMRLEPETIFTESDLFDDVLEDAVQCMILLNGNYQVAMIVKVERDGQNAPIIHYYSLSRFNMGAKTCCMNDIVHTLDKVILCEKIHETTGKWDLTVTETILIMVKKVSKTAYHVKKWNFEAAAMKGLIGIDTRAKIDLLDEIDYWDEEQIDIKEHSPHTRKRATELVGASWVSDEEVHYDNHVLYEDSARRFVAEALFHLSIM